MGVRRGSELFLVLFKAEVSARASGAATVKTARRRSKASEGAHGRQPRGSRERGVRVFALVTASGGEQRAGQQVRCRGVDVRRSHAQAHTCTCMHVHTRAGARVTRATAAPPCPRAVVQSKDAIRFQVSRRVCQSVS